MKELTQQQQVACDEYLIINNWLQAMLKANYSYKYANKRGWELLDKPHIKAYIDEKRAKLAKKADITAERIMAEMAKVGFANLQNYVDKGNGIKDLTKLPADVAAAVESVEVNGKKSKVKLHSKLGALNSLAEILKIKEVAGRVDIKVLNIGGLQALESGSG